MKEKIKKAMLEKILKVRVDGKGSQFEQELMQGIKNLKEELERKYDIKLTINVNWEIKQEVKSMEEMAAVTAKFTREDSEIKEIED